MSERPTEEKDRVLCVITTRHVSVGWLLGMVIGLGLLVARPYYRVYNEREGWTKIVHFGQAQADQTLPRLQRLPHDAETPYGYDGQYYAQMAIDPSLQDPAFDRALDNPAYRARRIGLPGLAFALGGGKPRRIIQVYAVANLGFWFVLCAALASLYRPWDGRRRWCLGAGLVSCGVIASLTWALVDLPATALVFVGVAIGSWGGYAALAAAVLTRETSLLAAVGGLDLRGPWNLADWKRRAGTLALVGLPFAGWLVYVGRRFHGVNGSAGDKNFAWPLQAMAARFADGWAQCASHGLGDLARKARLFGWLYLDFRVGELLIIAALVFQGAYLLWRRDVRDVFWRIGMCYLALGAVLGPAVWEQPSAAARVLLPMTLCFYLRLARERGTWFWIFFLLGGLSIPYAVHGLWVFS